MTSNAKIKPKKEKNVPPKEDKILELLNLLNNSEKYDTKLFFWRDKNEFGDIVGLIPFERFYERKRGSIYMEFIDKVKDIYYKFVVIDISVEESSIKNNVKNMKKKNILAESGMHYIVSRDINIIYREVLNIE